MRILFTIPNFITAGSGRAMLNVVERLDRTRFTPSICVGRRGGSLERVVNDLGIPLLVAATMVATRPFFSLYARVQRAAAALRPYEFDLWHSFNYSDDYTEPLVARAAGARIWIFTKKNMGWNHRSWLARSILAGGIAALNTDMLLQFFASPVLRAKVSLLVRGVDTSRFTPAEPHRLRLRENLGVPESSLLVGCVANLLPIKGQATLIRAMERAPGAHAVLAGPRLDETYAVELERLAEEPSVAGRVHFMGSVTDVPALLSEIDVFVLPTLSPGEGCGVALLEAMSSGRACVASDVSGCRDVVEAGRSGILVPPGDADALARALAGFELPGVRALFGEAARRRVLQQFTLEREARAHEQLYDELFTRLGR